MSSALQTSFTVSFGDNAGGGADRHLSAETDSRPDGLNGGKTSFVPGDTAFFLVYKSANVSYDAPIPSAGTVARAGSETVEKSTDLVFAGSREASLPIPGTIVGQKWLGASLGSLTVDGNRVTCSGEGVGICRVTVRTTADAYSLASPASVAGETDFPITVFIVGRVS